jgi:hypothetical protein
MSSEAKEENAFFDDESDSDDNRVDNNNNNNVNVNDVNRNDDVANASTSTEPPLLVGAEADDALRRGNELKQRGNEFFSNNKFDDAVLVYSDAISAIRYTEFKSMFFFFVNTVRFQTIVLPQRNVRFIFVIEPPVFCHSAVTRMRCAIAPRL